LVCDKGYAEKITSWLPMDVNDDARLLNKRGPADTIASRLAPTGNCDRQQKTPQLSQRGFGYFGISA